MLFGIVDTGSAPNGSIAEALKQPIQSDVMTDGVCRASLPLSLWSVLASELPSSAPAQDAATSKIIHPERGRSIHTVCQRQDESDWKMPTTFST